MEEFPLSPVTASGPVQDAIEFCHPLASSESNVLVSNDYEMLILF